MSVSPGTRARLRASAVVLMFASTMTPTVALGVNGYFQHGYGNAAKSMAGVAFALPQDALVTATNPAGLSLVADRLDVALDWMRPVRNASIDGNRLITLRSADGDWSGNAKSQLFVPELGWKSSSGRLSYGISAYGNGGLNTDYERNPFFAFGSTGNLGIDLAQLFVAPAISWQGGDRWSVGAALVLAAQRFEAYGLDAFSTTSFPGPYSESPADLTNRGHDYSYGYGVRIGALVEPLQNLTVGAAWQPRLRIVSSPVQ